MIVVDGGSRDETVTRAREAGVHVVVEPRSGYGAACLAGARCATPECQVIAFMDGDSSDDPTDLSRIMLYGVRCTHMAPLRAIRRDVLDALGIKSVVTAGT